MLEGARKYGRHNYRVIGVACTTYLDAAARHLNAFEEGEDTDPDSGICHLSKAIATLFVLRDAMMRGNWTDDRPPKSSGFIAVANDLAAKVIDRYPDAKDPYTEKGLIEATRRDIMEVVPTPRYRSDEP